MSQVDADMAESEAIANVLIDLMRDFAEAQRDERALSEVFERAKGRLRDIRAGPVWIDELDRLKKRLVRYMRRESRGEDRDRMLQLQIAFTGVLAGKEKDEKRADERRDTDSDFTSDWTWLTAMLLAVREGGGGPMGELLWESGLRLLVITPDDWVKYEPATKFFTRWESWVGFVAFVLAMVYIPWHLFADNFIARALVDFMAEIFPLIKGIPAEARHRPMSASELQLSVLYLVCVGVVATKVITQPPPIFLARFSTPRLYLNSSLAIAIPGFGIGLLMLTTGEGIGTGSWHKLYTHRFGVVILHTISWVLFLIFLSFFKSSVQELLRRLREALFRDNKKI